MEDNNMKSTEKYGNGWEHPRRRSNGRVAGGLVLVIVGLVILAVKVHVIFLPHWVFSWQMFLIVLGLFLGFRHGFRRPGWLVLMLIGSYFLLSDFFEATFNLHLYFWPILIICIGLWIMLKPRRDYHPGQFGRRTRMPGPPDFAGPTASGNYNNPATDKDVSTEDYVDATTIFGGTKRTIISKNFKGGEIVSVFGGTELNLTQADIQHPVVLETTQIFGGTSLIVPAHWEVKSEVTAIMGGVDDKRPVMPHGYEPNKVLVIKGLTLFGGLNIKNY
ncbi:hypothetical protein I2I11_00080 [Pontibacter sp. 172403-2]|uniref:LiaF transmembrane domain-containing protein n=1 Tax=Pontibacter rufus TaxID=2791028 RepID=UPI0018AFB632|nr:LiaF domain-containing protein [Pontibacter sp. 172403-2]MBF9251682.1 hypothetical protein [Pontibacter sp. 172403-2]